MGIIVKAKRRAMRVRVCLLLALLATQVCAESADVAEMEELAPKEGWGSWLGKVSGLQSLIEAGEGQAAGKDGGAPRVHETGVNSKYKLGRIPQCELPVSAAYPRGTGPCDQMEAATKAAEEEAKAKANVSPEAKKVQADIAKDEAKRDDKKNEALKREEVATKTKIENDKAQLKELEDKARAAATPKPGQSKNDVPNSAVSQTPQQQQEAKKLKAELKKAETKENKIIVERAKVADNKVDNMMAQVANLPDGPARDKVERKINKAKEAADAKAESAKEIKQAVKKIESEQKAVDKEKKEVAVLPTGSTPKAEGVLDVKKKEAEIKQEEEVVEGKPATPRAVDLPKKTQTFKEYGKSSQSACCNTNQEFEFLDLKGDGKKGFMASRSDCEKQCRNFNDPKTNKKCLFFEINPDASVDWCTGFSSCDRQCTVQYKRAHTIYQLGGIPLKPKKTSDNKPVELAAKTKTPAPPGATSSAAAKNEKKEKSDVKKAED